MNARRHRHHHKKPAADIGVVSARHERRKALLAKAAESSGLPESEPANRKFVVGIACLGR
jgi:hypothetical protein